MVHMADTSPDTSQRSGSKRSMDTSRHHHHGSGDPQDAGRLAKSRKVMPVFPSPKRSTGFSIDSLMSKEPPRGEASRPRVASSPTAADGRPGGSPDASPIPRGPAPHRRSPLTESPSPASRVGGSGGGVPPHIGPRAHHHQHQQHPHLSHHGNRPAGHPGTSMPGGHGAGLLGVHHGGLAYPSPAAAAAAAAAGLPHPAFLNGLSPAAMETGPGLHHHNPALEAAALAHLIPGGHAGHGTMFPGGPPGCLPPGFGGMPHGGLAGMPSSPHHGLNPHLLGLTQKDNFPFYTWLLSRHGNLLNRGFSGAEAAYLFPFRKAKRIRTAFSPSQLLRLEHAFEKNHYVVGQERKELAVNLNLTETQVKVWFQNRRTKYKRMKAEEEEKVHHSPTTTATQSVHTNNNNNNNNNNNTNSNNYQNESSSHSSTNHHQYHNNNTDALGDFEEHESSDSSMDHSQPYKMSSASSDSEVIVDDLSRPSSPKKIKTTHHVNRWRVETNQV